MKQFVLTSILILSIQSVTLAQEITVEQFEFGTDVQNREIVSPDSVFSANVERVFCFTHITGMEEEGSITHIWYLDGQEMASVDLAVRSSDWRTWSSKTILIDWTGDWSVDVLDAEGNLLMSKAFTIGE